MQTCSFVRFDSFLFFLICPKNGGSNKQWLKTKVSCSIRNVFENSGLFALTYETSSHKTHKESTSQLLHINDTSFYSFPPLPKNGFKEHGVLGPNHRETFFSKKEISGKVMGNFLF